MLYCYTYTLSAALLPCIKTIFNEVVYSTFRNNPIAMGCPPFLTSKSLTFYQQESHAAAALNEQLWVKGNTTAILFIYLFTDESGLQKKFCICICF